MGSIVVMPKRLDPDAPVLLASDQLLSRFRELLASATRVDLATAWATEGPALDALREVARRLRKPCIVRALVGLRGNATTPEALEELHRIGKLRVVEEGRLFHPKLYLFHQTKGGGVAWVGSANFTGMGFGGDRGNEEVVVETRATRQIGEWFKGRWSQAEPLKEGRLATYREQYRAPERGWRDERLGSGRGPGFSYADGDPTPSNYFREPILRALREMGGRGSREDVLERVHRIMRGRLVSADEKPYPSKPRVSYWQQYSDNQRQTLVRQGLVEPSEERGMWELTDQGWSAT